jgi:hypothetical protein
MLLQMSPAKPMHGPSNTRRGLTCYKRSIGEKRNCGVRIHEAGSSCSGTGGHKVVSSRHPNAAECLLYQRSRHTAQAIGDGEEGHDH